MSKEHETYETAGTYQLFHGSMNQFEEFSLDNVGKNGTAQGFGIYLTPNKEMAGMYASKREEQGYLYTVDVELNKSVSLDERTVTEEELSEIIDRLQESNDILNDFNDVDYYGEKVVKREVLATLNENENDVDLMNEIANTIGDDKKTAEVFYEVGGYTHAVAGNQLRQQDHVVIIFDPERVKIEKVQDLNIERDVPAVTADPFSDDEEKFTDELEVAQEFWKEAISKNQSFEIYGYSVENGERLVGGVSQIYAPSTREGYAYQLTKIGKEGIPYSHFDVTQEEIDKTLEGKSNELLSRLPHGSEQSEYVVHFYESEGEINMNNKQPIKEVVLNDIGMNLDLNYQYYNPEAWQDRVETMQASDVEPSRFSLDEDVEAFYETHKQEIEERVNETAKMFSTDNHSALGLAHNSSKLEYKRASSNLAYNLAVSELSNEMDKGSFEIPAMSKEVENGTLRVENSRSFEME